MATVVPYRNPSALIAYYPGVFSLAPCLGLLLAPFALVLGILGLRYRKRNPHAHGLAHAWVGIIVGALSLLGHGAVIARLAINSREAGRVASQFYLANETRRLGGHD